MEAPKYVRERQVVLPADEMKVAIKYFMYLLNTMQLPNKIVMNVFFFHS